MMVSRNQKRMILHNQQGSLAIDFLFAFILIFGFTTILLSLSLTLTAVEMTQYLTFSSARAYFASHLRQEDQGLAARKKYTQLLGTDGYSFLAQGTWFAIFPEPFVGNAAESPELEAYQQEGGNPNRFEGAVTYFTARILSYSSPFFGSTDPEGDGTGSRFSTHIGSYLGREPSVEECRQFNEQRWAKIRNLSVARGGQSYSTGTDDNDYFVITDNGC